MILRDPWFWAFLSMLGWFLAAIVVATRTWGSSRIFGAFAVGLVEVPRFILPLAFVTQPRIAVHGNWLTVLGSIILAASLLFALPVVRIQAFSRPQSREPLRTSGFYAIVRHPLYICDSFWPLGWSLLCRSAIGAALTVLWVAVAYLFTFLEEQKLVEEYGDSYRQYQTRVSRLIPFLRLH